MAQPDASRLYQLADDVARHEFSIPIARTMKLQEIQEAHRIFEQRRTSGKNRTGSVITATPRSLQMAI
jgi:NADPH:quinone reductase-like Zn-dependent oxidoreductase